MSHRWKRAPPGCDPGTREEPGDRLLLAAARFPVGSGHRTGRRVIGALAGLGQGEGPSISYMEGPSLRLCGKHRQCGHIAAMRKLMRKLMCR